MNMTPQEWRTRVGLPVEMRRRELGIDLEAAARFAGFSRSWWRQLETGYRNREDVRSVDPKHESLAAAARALRWTPESLQRLKRGEEPLEAPATAEVEPEMVELLNVVLDNTRRGHVELLTELGRLASVVQANVDRLGEVDERLARLEGVKSSPARRPAQHTRNQPSRT